MVGTAGVKTLALVIAVATAASVLGSIAFASVSAAAGTAQPVAGSGQWSLDEGSGSSSADSTGGNRLTLFGGPRWVEGVRGSALRFSGEQQYAGTDSAVVDTSGDYSISAWVTFESIPDMFATAVSQDGAQPENPFYLQYGFGAFAFSTPGGNRARLEMKPDIGTWYHLVGVHDEEAGENRLFLDGELAATSPAEPGLVSSGAFTIGRGAFEGAQTDFWKGAVDEVKAFDRVLSADEVAALAIEFDAAPTVEEGPPVALIAGSAALLAGVIAMSTLLLLRRRARGTPFDDSLLRTDTSASWLVDRSLRVLIAGSEQAGTQVPKILGVFIEGSSIRVKLANPQSNPPPPWTASEDGQSWSALIDRLQREPVTEGSTKIFARLVNLGLAQSGRIFVDFARARGPITLEGSPPSVHEVLRRWLSELTGNPWSDEPRVVMIGNGLPQPRGAERMENLDQLVPELETHSRGVLVLSQAPSSAQQSMLMSRFASHNFGWVIVVLAGMPTAKWRFRVGDDGILRSGLLPDVQFMDRPAARRRS